jgi:hypothetical protein
MRPGLLSYALRVLAFQNQNPLPEDRRRYSLSRFPLIDDGLSGGTNRMGKGALSQSETTTQSSYVLIVVVRHDRQGKRANLLARESAVMTREKSFAGCTRGRANWSTECRSHTEVRIKSTCSCRGLQRSDVDAKLLGELIERQQLLFLSVVRDSVNGPTHDRDRNRPPAAVPCPERFDWNGYQRCKLALPKISRPPQFTQGIHAPHNHATRRDIRKATSGIHGR